MAERVLCVADAPQRLDAYQARLAARYDLQVALGSHEGLAALVNRGPFAVVVVEQQLGACDGIQFLAQCWQRAPETVRLLLAEGRDGGFLLRAIEEAYVFRALGLPCPPEQLAAAIDAALAEYRHGASERELPWQTACGSIKALLAALELANPVAHARGVRIRELTGRLAQALGVERTWELEIAALLSQMGCVGLTEAAIQRAYLNSNAAPAERSVFQQHSQAAHDVLAHLPQLRGVAEVVRYQEKCYDGSGFPAEGTSGAEIPLGARILKVVLDFDRCQSSGMGPDGALAMLCATRGAYDPAVVGALATWLEIDISQELVPACVATLHDGAILAEDATTDGGTVLVPKGSRVTPEVRKQLREYARSVSICEPIKTFVPRTNDERNASEPANQPAATGSPKPANKARRAQRRRASRQRFGATQLIAPYQGGELPGRSMYREVRCEDISTLGFSYLASEPPEIDSLIVALGHDPHVTLMAARVMNTVPVAAQPHPLVRVGCRFTGRIEAG